MKRVSKSQRGSGNTSSTRKRLRSSRPVLRLVVDSTRSMKRTFFAILICFAVSLSPSAQKAAPASAPPRVPGIDTSGMDRSVRPQDDFFRFVNGNWADKTPIPADRSNYGTFAELRDRAQEAVRGILEAEAIKTEAPGSIGQKVEIGRASG